MQAQRMHRTLTRFFYACLTLAAASLVGFLSVLDGEATAADPAANAGQQTALAVCFFLFAGAAVLALAMRHRLRAQAKPTPDGYQ